MAHFLAPTGIVITILDVYVERHEDRLGIPSLYLWALSEDGDDEWALDRALGEALGDLWRLLLSAHEDPTGATEHEAALCRKFCRAAEVTIDWNDLPDRAQAILRRWPAGKLAERRAVAHALSPIVISGKLMLALADPVGEAVSPSLGVLGAHSSFGGTVDTAPLDLDLVPWSVAEETEDEE